MAKMDIPNLEAIRDWCRRKFQQKGDYALGADVKKVSDSLGGLEFGYDRDGNPGWKDGADTVHPFSSGGGAAGTGMIAVVPSKYDTLANGFVSMSQTGLCSPMPIEANPFFEELGGHVAITVATDFTVYAKAVQEG